MWERQRWSAQATALAYKYAIARKNHQKLSDISEFEYEYYIMQAHGTHTCPHKYNMLCFRSNVHISISFSKIMSDKNESEREERGGKRWENESNV